MYEFREIFSEALILIECNDKKILRKTVGL